MLPRPAPHRALFAAVVAVAIALVVAGAVSAGAVTNPGGGTDPVTSSTPVVPVPTDPTGPADPSGPTPSDTGPSCVECGCPAPVVPSQTSVSVVAPAALAVRPQDTPKGSILVDYRFRINIDNTGKATLAEVTANRGETYRKKINNESLTPLANGCYKLIFDSYLVQRREREDASPWQCSPQEPVNAKDSDGVAFKRWPYILTPKGNRTSFTIHIFVYVPLD